MPAPTGWGVPRPGDRSVRDTHTYPDLHASDIEEEEYTYHNPWPMADGEAAVSDGDKLVPTDIATQAELDAHTEDTSNPHEVAHDQLGGVTADQHHDQAHTLGSADDHSDVDISTPPEVGQALVWDGTKWIPGDAGGGGSGSAVGYAETIGDGAETAFTIVHELDATDVIVQVYDLDATPYPAQVTPHVEVVDADTVEVSFTEAPGTDQYRVVIVAVGEGEGGGGAGSAVSGARMYRANANAAGAASGARALPVDTVEYEGDGFTCDENTCEITVDEAGWYAWEAHVRLNAAVSNYHVLSLVNADGTATIGRGTQINGTHLDIQASGLAYLTEDTTVYASYYSGFNTQIIGHAGGAYTYFCLVRLG